jgi:hypothetical protein
VASHQHYHRQPLRLPLHCWQLHLSSRPPSSTKYHSAPKNTWALTPWVQSRHPDQESWIWTRPCEGKIPGISTSSYCGNIPTPGANLNVSSSFGTIQNDASLLFGTKVSKGVCNAMFETSEDKDPDFSFRELECPFIFLHLADTLISNRTRFGCPEDIYTNNPRRKQFWNYFPCHCHSSFWYVEHSILRPAFRMDVLLWAYTPAAALLNVWLRPPTMLCLSEYSSATFRNLEVRGLANRLGSKTSIVTWTESFQARPVELSTMQTWILKSLRSYHLSPRQACFVTFTLAFGLLQVPNPYHFYPKRRSWE